MTLIDRKALAACPFIDKCGACPWAENEWRLCSRYMELRRKLEARISEILARK